MDRDQRGATERNGRRRWVGKDRYQWDAEGYSCIDEQGSRQIRSITDLVEKVNISVNNSAPLGSLCGHRPYRSCSS